MEPAPCQSACCPGIDSTDDLYSVGKTMFVALIGVVELEIALISRFWTRIYFLFWFLSFILVRYVIRFQSGGKP